MDLTKSTAFDKQTPLILVHTHPRTLMQRGTPFNHNYNTRISSPKSNNNHPTNPLSISQIRAVEVDHSDMGVLLSAPMDPMRRNTRSKRPTSERPSDSNTSSSSQLASPPIYTSKLQKANPNIFSAVMPPKSPPPSVLSSTTQSCRTNPPKKRNSVPTPGPGSLSMTTTMTKSTPGSAPQAISHSNHPPHRSKFKIKIRDFAFAQTDDRYRGLGPSAPKPNQFPRLNKKLGGSKKATPTLTPPSSTTSSKRWSWSFTQEQGNEGLNPSNDSSDFADEDEDDDDDDDKIRPRIAFGPRFGAFFDESDSESEDDDRVGGGGGGGGNRRNKPPTSPAHRAPALFKKP